MAPPATSGSGMWRRLVSLWRVTAIRLSIAYTLTFGILALGLIFYMTGAAVNYLRELYETSINEEVTSLQTIYRDSGLNAAIAAMENRSRAPGAKLYVVTDPAGRIIAGNVRSIAPDVLNRTGWIFHPFAYEPFRETADGRVRRSVARIVQLPNGMRILIGQDIGEPERLRDVVRRAVSLSMLLMLVAGFLIWFLVGRRALKRISLVSKSTERILAGDRSERLPITGSRDEFDRLSEKMNEMLDRITTLDSGLREVSDSIAHDLKTPITRLRNKADAALGRDDPQASRAALEDVITDADQIIKTFNALLMISRVEAGSQIAEMGELDLAQLAGDVIELYEPLAEEHGATITSQLASGMIIRGNRELLSQALSNLLDNALKYGLPADGNDGILAVAVEQSGKNRQDAIISVSDNGPGIPEAERDRMKERFTRLDASRSQPGTGLGLSLVEAVANLHGGRLELRSNAADGDKPARGLRVELHLPLAKQ